MTRDDIARAIYDGWRRGKIAPPYDDLPSWRRCQWEAAADEVIALLPPLVRPLPDSLVITDEVRAEATERIRLIDRLKRRAVS